jgi:hypothetical protein
MDPCVVRCCYKLGSRVDMSRSVYVLGAGASKHIGYPLASTMGAEMLTWMSVRERYKGTADSSRERCGDSPNIEAVVTELEGVVIAI